MESNILCNLKCFSCQNRCHGMFVSMILDNCFETFCRVLELMVKKIRFQRCALLTWYLYQWGMNKEYIAT